MRQKILYDGNDKVLYKDDDKNAASGNHIQQKSFENEPNNCSRRKY